MGERRKITDRLTSDHKMFLKIGDDIDAMSNLPPAKRDRAKLIHAVELMKRLLTFHAGVEDQSYYPMVREAVKTHPAPPINEAYIDHLYHEHQTISGYLHQLEDEVKATPPVPTWPQTFALFYSGLKVHQRREEAELFPASEAILGAARLEELGEE